MIKEKEQLLDKVIAVCGHEHKKTILFAEILEIASDDPDAIAKLEELAEQIIKYIKLKNLFEREEN